MIEIAPAEKALEMWGGIECSFVRVNGDVRDQLAWNGHLERLDDLDAIASLGVRALRYPVLWERHPDPNAIDWSWTDERLNRLRELGIRPIVGLIHHGCGPLPGGLLDPGFVNGLAAFACAVAERYPWIDAYTPVNEPNTTARFSGLYGLWHPHGRDVTCFGRCLLNECLATRAAMKAIREINPAAELIQTEDVGKTHSTPKLGYQAEYENERRWITFDILCGRIDPKHPVHAHLLDCGVPASELESFVEDPCPPDVLGMNHYVTSERFLDERLDRYPAGTHGGNGREPYADVDAVRVRAEGLIGVRGLLHEMWQRYRRPIAITEVQLACTREEQVRWLVEIWREAAAAKQEGVDVRAVTPWALLGAFDWNTLLVEPRRYYENGAFDVRGRTPRLTAVGRAIAALAHEGTFEHPVLAMPGWWRRPLRLEYTPVPAPATGPGTAFREEPRPKGKPLLVLGAAGTLGRAFLRLCDIRGLPAIGLTRQQLDVTHPAGIAEAMRAFQPWAVVNCAGYVRVDEAERFPETWLRDTVAGATNVAQACAAAGARLVLFSTDHVFNGSSGRPYVEADAPEPVNWFGRSKHSAEQRVAALNSDALIIRTSATFGPWDDFNFAIRTLRALTARRRVRAVRDIIISPTYIPDLVNAALDLLIDGERGIWHLANRGAIHWHGWAAAIASSLRIAPEYVTEASPNEVGWLAPRPPFSALDSDRGALLPTWEDALDRFLAVVADSGAEAAA